MADSSELMGLIRDAATKHGHANSELAILCDEAADACEDGTLTYAHLREIAEWLNLERVPVAWVEAAEIVPDDVLEVAADPARWVLVRALDAIEHGVVVEFEYRNYRGEQATRHVQPRALRHGPTAYHKTPGWKLEAFDIDRNDVRTFDTMDIRDWREVKP